MAKYRAVQTTFWDDAKVVEDFSSDDKYLFLYLLTNQKTNQIGCYELLITQICRDTGLSKQKVLKILQKLEENLKVIVYDYETKEVFLKNWYKYNWLSSIKTKKCIEKEFETIKSVKIKDLISPLYTPYMLQGEKEEEKNKKNKNKKNSEKKEENSIDDAPSSTPTLTDIISYAYDLGIDDKNYCKKFFNHYEAVGWVNGTNCKIKNWKLVFYNWLTGDGLIKDKPKEKYIELDENGELVEVEK